MKTVLFLVAIPIVYISLTSESRAADSYTYDDEGRVVEFVKDNSTKVILDYSSGNISASVYYAGSGGWYINNDYTVDSLGDDTYMIYENINDGNSHQSYAAIINGNGRLLQDGNNYHYSNKNGDGEIVNTGNVWHSNLATYAYDEETGQQLSRTKYNCQYITGPSECTSSTIQMYTRDIDGNTIKEYITGLSGQAELVAIHNYTDNYIANQNCTATKSCTSCPGGKVLQEGECVSSCGASFKLNDGECDRIRYTPAEAAQYLKDTDNEIIMTFKINR